MIEVMICTELPAAAMGLPSRSTEALSRDDKAGAILHTICSGGLSIRIFLNVEQILSQTDLTSAQIR